jgi:hydroxyethylthiazole kinase
MQLILDEDIVSVWAHLKKTVPLILNITNYVSVNYVANALLALGASPIMAHAENELEDLVKQSRALVLNIGTLDDRLCAQMKHALVFAKKYQIPVVLDPVGVHATPYRLRFAEDLLAQGGIAVIRGNASEIMALAHQPIGGQGVDGASAVVDLDGAAHYLIKHYQVGIVATGVVDTLYDGTEKIVLSGGHALMSKVTGMGCAASAILGAFLGSESNRFLAMKTAMSLMKSVGGFVGDCVEGPGQFSSLFLDILYQSVFDQSLQDNGIV